MKNIHGIKHPSSYDHELFFDHEYNTVLTNDQREIKGITYKFELDGLIWFTLLKDFSSEEEFAETYYKFFGIPVDKVYKCWMFRKGSELMSFPTEPNFDEVDSEFDFIGVYYCYVLFTDNKI